jgi:hypothetical protein
MAKKSPTLTIKFCDDKEVKQTPWAALEHVKQINSKNEGNFTDAEKATAEQMLAQARAAFIRSTCYRNYRANSIVIKVASPKASDKLTSAVDAFELAMAKLGAERKNENGHYLYHIFQR